MRPPDLSSRPFSMTTERVIDLPIEEVYDAWTTDVLSRWFAATGSVRMEAVVDAPFYFETEHAGERHPHYGRFLALERPRLIELTWLNEAGTRGHETVVTVELIPTERRTRVKLTHAGFADAETRDRHEAAWPDVLAQLESELTSD
jgi:uncharacterized protein YndB with AHSA1/START domain